MSNIERIYYMLQENDCGHWLRDNADTLSLAAYLDKMGCVAMPYKIGDKIYHNIAGEEEPQEYTVVGFYCEKEPKIVYSQFIYNDKTYDHKYYVNDDGVHFHTSREDAIKSHAPQNDEVRA